VSNNPLRYSDPTGHCFIVCIKIKDSFLGAIVGVIIQVAIPYVGPPLGATVLQQSSIGGGILAAEFVGTSLLGSPAASALFQAEVLAADAAAGVKMNYGQAAEAIAVDYALSYASKYLTTPVEKGGLGADPYLVAGARGAISSYVNKGNVTVGALTQFTAAVLADFAGQIYQAQTGKAINLSPGREPNTFGTEKEGWCQQGNSSCSWLGNNLLLGGKAIADFHDPWMSYFESIGFRDGSVEWQLVNWATMLPSLAVTYVGVVDKAAEILEKVQRQKKLQQQEGSRP
jgi:hypothetical protein